PRRRRKNANREKTAAPCEPAGPERTPLSGGKGERGSEALWRHGAYRRTFPWEKVERNKHRSALRKRGGLFLLQREWSAERLCPACFSCSHARTSIPARR